MCVVLCTIVSPVPSTALGIRATATIVVTNNVIMIMAMIVQVIGDGSIGGSSNTGAMLLEGFDRYSSTPVLISHGNRSKSTQKYCDTTLKYATSKSSLLDILRTTRVFILLIIAKLAPALAKAFHHRLYCKEVCMTFRWYTSI